MRNQSEAASVLCKPIGAKLWPISEQSSDQYPSTGRTATLCRIVICTSANTTWRTAGTVWSVQNLRQLSLHGTNITSIQNSKIQPTSSFTFSPVQLQYTPLVIRRTSKNKQLTIIKPTQTGINRNKWPFCTIKSLEPLKIQTPAAPLS